MAREVSERVRSQFTVPVRGQEGPLMAWKVLSERTLYRDEWFDIRLAALLYVVSDSPQ